MREMQGAEDEPEGSLHEVNDRRRIPIATQQITYFYTPTLYLGLDGGLAVYFLHAGDEIEHLVGVADFIVVP